MLWLKINSKVILVSLLVIGLCWVMTACATSGDGTSSSDSKVENKVSSNDDLTLEDYLRRLSGVRVTGSGNNLRVFIRSNNLTIGKGTVTQPLFVINGQEMGHNLSEIMHLISPGEINSVEAIPAARAAEYGIQGGSGVIVIETE